MIDNENQLLPIVCFDKNDDWDTVRNKCIDYIDLQGQNRLAKALGTNVSSVAIEYHYIDKDYRDTFSNFHSKRFNTPISRCVRLHFFSRHVNYDDLKDAGNVQENYLGYSVIRPTRPNCIGRTLLDIKNYIGTNIYICTCTEKVNLQGTELVVEGFPFISQDGDATVCAQSALWMIARYYSNRYSLYSETYPFQLTQLTRDYSIGRLYPSDGLTMWQLGESLRQLGFSPLIYNRDNYKNNFDHLLYTYIESGIPVIAGVPGHVIAAFGHASDFSNYEAHDIIFASDFCTALIVNDDNHIPYQELTNDGFGDSKYKTKDVDSFIVALPEKVFLSAENFEKVVRKLLQDKSTGISNFAPELSNDSLILRIYLTTVKSYKKKVIGRGMGDPLVEKIYRELPLPHFIWVCELSNHDAYSKGHIFGEIIWDATRNVWETEGWIAIHYPEVLLVDSGSALNGPQKIHKLRLTNKEKNYLMYKSNLKEI